jgi:hypothetical protein
MTQTSRVAMRNAAHYLAIAARAINDATKVTGVALNTDAIRSYLKHVKHEAATIEICLETIETTNKET